MRRMLLVLSWALVALAPAREADAVDCARTTTQGQNFIVCHADALHERHCTEALFLDGTISSLCWPALKRADDHSALGPMIAIVE
jgi:uncharacterized protein YigE (DUF2233 family)